MNNQYFTYTYMTHITLELALHCQEYFDNEHLPCAKTFLCKVEKKNQGDFYKKKLQKKIAKKMCE